MIGQTISHYKILEKLGEGGMGVVYKAQDLKLGRYVALKFLPSHLNADEELKRRFIQEAKAASALDHPSICNIHEINDTEDGQTFICMAHYEGETLKKKLEWGPLELEEAIEVAIQISQGLAKAHQQGIVHRDIKPANVMITLEGTVKIVDFGLAKLAHQTRITKEGTTPGTVAYMSPEQAKGEKIDARTDIWSLGVVLYQMLTGRLPFDAQYEQAVIYNILHDQPRTPSRIRKEIPPELERIVLKCLAKKPAERYQRLEELTAELSRLGNVFGADEITPVAGSILTGSNKKAVRKYVVFGLLFGGLILLPVLYFLFKPDSQKKSQPAPVVWVVTTNPEAYRHWTLGNQFFDQQKLNEAIAEYKKAIGLDSNFLPAYQQLAEAMTWLYGNEPPAGGFIQKMPSNRVPQK